MGPDITLTNRSKALAGQLSLYRHTQKKNFHDLLIKAQPGSSAYQRHKAAVEMTRNFSVPIYDSLHALHHPRHRHAAVGLEHSSCQKSCLTSTICALEAFLGESLIVISKDQDPPSDMMSIKSSPALFDRLALVL